MSKLDQVIDIVKSFNGNKKDLLDKIQTDLGITRSNASVYLFKASKQIDVPDSTPVIEPTKVPEIVKERRILSQAQMIEYQLAMTERKNAGFSEMEADDYFDMVDNLKSLL